MPQFPQFSQTDPRKDPSKPVSGSQSNGPQSNGPQSNGPKAELQTIIQGVPGVAVFPLDWLLQVKAYPRHPNHEDRTIGQLSNAVMEIFQNFIQSNKRIADDDVGSSSGVSSSSADKKRKPDTETVKDPIVTGDAGKQQPKASEDPNGEGDFKLVTFKH